MTIAYTGNVVVRYENAGGGPSVSSLACTPQAIAAWQTLLGYDTIEETLQAMLDARDDGRVESDGSNLWTPLYDAVEASLCSAATPAAMSRNASDTITADTLTQARNTARQRLGLAPIPTGRKRLSAARTTPANTPQTTLPDGLEQAVTAARDRFMRQLTTPQTRQ